MENSNSLPKRKAISSEKKWSRSFFFRTLLNGLFLVLPTIIILILLSVIFKFVFNIVAPISALLDKNADTHTFITNIVALMILISLIFLIGFITSDFRNKRSFKRFEDTYLLRIPLYSTLRGTIDKFAGQKKMPFSQVVLVDAYNTGVLLTGFITETVTKDIYTVFVPTAPNPMNGNIYHVPARQLRFLDVEPEKAMRSIVGMGTGSSALFEAKVIFQEEELTDSDPKFDVKV